MIRRWAGPIVCLALCACRPRPEVTPSSEARRETAAKAAAQARPLEERAGYEEGFRSGARMVEEAMRTGRRPFLPHLGAVAPAPVLRSALPADLQVHPEAGYDVEMDEDTGLVKSPVPEGPSGFGRGQVDGFQWFLKAHREKLAQPHPQPALPKNWDAWPASSTTFRVAGGDPDVELAWGPGLLAWSVRERGFAPRRWWRPLAGEAHPTHAALAGDALWIDTGREALALDLETGAIRRVAPAPAHVPETGGPDAAPPAPLSAEARSRLEAAGAQGDAEALFRLGSDDQDGGRPEAARVWWRKAAEGGHTKAMTSLGSLYLTGLGGPVDRDEARRWFERAHAAGSETAGGLLQELEGLDKQSK